MRKFHFWLSRKEKPSPYAGAKPEKVLSGRLGLDLAILQNILGTSNDIAYRPFQIGLGKEVQAVLIFVDGLVDKKMINDHILRPLMAEWSLNSKTWEKTEKGFLSSVECTILSVTDTKQLSHIDELVSGILSGHTLLLLDRSKQALMMDTRGWQTRGINEPETEAVIRGPREGFTETLRTNTSMLRRKIKDPNLTFDTMRLGTRSKTDVSITYIKGIVGDGLVDEIKQRLKKIDTDAILESGYIEQFIEDNPFSIFATIGNSEKPDVVAAKILEGRAAILVDGTPIVLTIPMLFAESFQSAEDYYSRPYYSSVLRIIRFAAFGFSVLSPALYVSLVAFHQELLPTAMLVTIAAAGEGTPFPSIVEMIGMGMIFEILREAGIRMPRSMGQAVSIVGALVIGQGAVTAGIVGAPIVIVVALTAIASFVVTPQADAGTILRFAYILSAGFLGLYGMAIFTYLVLIHLTSIRSFGIPYFSPFSPPSFRELKDVFIRAPLKMMRDRPKTLEPADTKRQGSNNN